MRPCPDSTRVLLRDSVTQIYSKYMVSPVCCEELDCLRSDAAATLLEAKQVRRTRDVSIHEDAELSRESCRKIDALIRHLLIGHDGSPCPAGERPIIKARVAISRR
jgi:hypothetical protein